MTLHYQIVHNLLWKKTSDFLNALATRTERTPRILAVRDTVPFLNRQR